jgi:hypothetical protein
MSHPKSTKRKKLAAQRQAKPSNLKFWVAGGLVIVLNAGLAASLWPHLANAAHTRADQLVEAGKRAQDSEAQVHFKIAQLLDPGNELAALTVAKQLLAQDQPERAVAVLDRAVEREAGESPAMHALAIQGLLEAGDTDRAVQQANALVTIAQTPGQLHLIALAYGVGEQTDRLARHMAVLSASEGARRAIAAAPHKLALAQELYATGLLRSSERILAGLPASITRNLLLASLKEHAATTESLTEARDLYRAAIELDLVNIPARQGLIRILSYQGEHEAANKQSVLLKRLTDGRP